MIICVCVCVCVQVREKKREREREGGGGGGGEKKGIEIAQSLLIIFMLICHSQTLDMLSKFKSKLFSARGVFGGGDEEEEKDTPIVKNDRDEVGEIGSHEPQTTTSDKGDTLKWYAERIVFHLVQIRLKMPAFCCMCMCVCVCALMKSSAITL